MAQPHIHVNILANNDTNREKEIFERISLGEETAFTYIFNHYADTLYTHAFRLLKSEFWAEETVQEVFVKLWADRAALTNIQSPGAYLFRMVVNKSLDRIRQHQADSYCQGL